MRILKLLTLLAFSAFFLVATSSWQPAGALSTGPFLERTGAPDEVACNTCHRTYPLDSGPGRVMIEGLPSQYTPGQVYPVTVRLADPLAKIWGFQITAITEEGHAAGFFQTETVAISALGPSLRLGRFYAEHTANGTYDGSRGEVSWNFKWKAPSSDLGPVTFYAAGNGGNGDHTDFYDYIYTTNVTIDGLMRNVRVRLESPALATPIGSGERFTVRWSATDGDTATPSSFRVLLSTDGGENYPSVLAADLPGTARSFAWNVPDALQTAEARIRVVAVDSEGVEHQDQSRANLTIAPMGLAAPVTIGEAPLGGNYRVQAWADVNGDGRRDVAVGRDAGGVLLYIQQDGGTFSEVTEASGLTAPGDVRGLAWGDADSDGRPDLAVVAVNATSIWRNAGDGTFTLVGAPTSLPRLADPKAVVWMDVDRDGRLDVVAGGTGGMQALRNTADGFVDASAAWAVPDGPVTGLAAGPRLLVATGAAVRLLGFDGGVLVNDAAALGTSATFAASAVAWADLTSDGWLDVVATGAPGHRVLAGVGGELRFGDVTAGLGIGSLAGGNRVLPGDYDLDGDVDLLVGSDAGVHVLRNRGASGFDDVTSRFAFPAGVRSAVWTDRDGSGAIDLGIATDDVLGAMANLRSGAVLRVRARTDADADAHAPDAQTDREALGAVVRVDLDGDGDWTTGAKVAVVDGGDGSPILVGGLGSATVTFRVDFVDGEGTEATAAAGTAVVDALDPLAPVVTSTKLSATGQKLTVNGVGFPATGGGILVDGTALGAVKAPPRFIGQNGTSTRLVGKDGRLLQLIANKPVAVRVAAAGVLSAPAVLR